MRPSITFQTNAATLEGTFTCQIRLKITSSSSIIQSCKLAYADPTGYTPSFSNFQNHLSFTPLLGLKLPMEFSNSATQSDSLSRSCSLQVRFQTQSLPLQNPMSLTRDPFCSDSKNNLGNLLLRHPVSHQTSSQKLVLSPSPTLLLIHALNHPTDFSSGQQLL